MTAQGNSDQSGAGPLDLPRLRDLYYHTLFDDCLPWWLTHSLDREQGGYFTRLERDGSRYADDKDMWMIGREVWMFSHLYNAHERRAEWLDAARLGAEFILRHGFADDGKAYFRLGRDGTPIADVLSKYTEVFLAIGLAEYSKAAADPAVWQRALDIYEKLIPKLLADDDTPLLGYPLYATFSVHAKPMCRMTVASAFHAVQADARFAADWRAAADDVIAKHWKPDMGALLENVAPDGSPMLHLQEGRMFHPGHAVESAWMLMEAARAFDDRELLDAAVEITLASLKQGWDERFGGLRYITNIDGTPVHNIEADCKLWWPHGEALYATLLGWHETGRADLAEWHTRVHDYTFAHFPDPACGEWYGYLNRDGSPIWSAKANGWKGCFHLPRVLLRCYQLLHARLASP